MEPEKVYIGIDPGKRGSLAVIDDDYNVLELIDYHENIASDMIKLKYKYTIKMGALEKVASMPGQGVTSVFSFGVNFGFWQGMLEALGIPFVLVRPQEWQKGLGLPKDKKDRKKAIAHSAKTRFPSAELYGPKGGLLDGRSDALMIASYIKKIS
jgi:crossover junction endodeoxyribonuclease RuvC